MSAGQMIADFKIYRAALEEAHAGLYLYISPAELNQEFRKIENRIAKPLYKTQFYKLLLLTTASLKHGHSFLVNDQMYGINYALRDLVPTEIYLPFTLKIIERKIFIAVNCSADSACETGSQLMSINGVSAEVLLMRFQNYIPADGGNENYKNFKLEGFLFHFLYRLFYPQINRYDIVVKTINGQLKKINLKGINPAIIEANHKARTGRSIGYLPQALEYKLIDGNTQIGYLKVFSFFEGLTNRNGMEFTSFIDSAFHDLSKQNVRKLIIDLRNNEGGNDSLAILLFSYLIDKPFVQGNPTYLKSDTITFLPHIENPEEDVIQFAQHPGLFEDKIGGKFILKKQFDELSYTVFSPKRPYYSGKVIILTNGGSFSATSRFINTAKYYLSAVKGKVKFVGEAYGGDDSKEFATGGQSINVSLPNSHFRLTIPVKEYTKLNTIYLNNSNSMDKIILQDHENLLEDSQLKKVIQYTRNL